MSVVRRAQLTFDDPVTGASTTVILDAAINEQHLVSAEVTSHQVEKGANITDHIRPMPLRISMEAMVTNTPIGPILSQSDGITTFLGDKEVNIGRGRTLNAKNVLQFSGDFDRVEAVYSLLKDAAQKGAIFSIYTTLDSYVNMAIVNLSVPRNVEMGNCMRFTIDMQELRFVEVSVGKALPPSIKKSAKRLGNQAPTELPAAQTPPVEKSTLWNLIN